MPEDVGTSEIPSIQIQPELRVKDGAESRRQHLDAIEMAQVIMPGVVAIVLLSIYGMLSYNSKVPVDGPLSAAIPVIVAAYFISHTGTSVKRRG